MSNIPLCPRCAEEISKIRVVRPSWWPKERTRMAPPNLFYAEPCGHFLDLDAIEITG